MLSDSSFYAFSSSSTRSNATCAPSSLTRSSLDRGIGGSWRLSPLSSSSGSNWSLSVSSSRASNLIGDSTLTFSTVTRVPAASASIKLRVCTFFDDARQTESSGSTGIFSISSSAMSLLYCLAGDMADEPSSTSFLIYLLDSAFFSIIRAIELCLNFRLMYGFENSDSTLLKF